MNRGLVFFRKCAPQFLVGVFAGLLFLVIPLYLYLVRNDVSSIVTLFGVFLTIYVAAYAIAWAKYEFHVSRQSQQMSVLTALCATDKRKSFAPALAEMTRKKLPKHPTLFTPHLIWASLSALPGDKDYLTEDNRDTIDMVAKILQGFADWQGANLEYIYLKDAQLFNVHLEGAYMHGAILENARLNYAHLHKTDLTGANLKNAKMRSCKMREVILDCAELNEAKMCRAILDGASLSGEPDFSGAKLERASFSDCNLSDVKLHGANIKYTELKFIIVDESTEMKLFEALSTAENLCSARLSHGVEIRLQEKYPHLFKTPNS